MSQRVDSRLQMALIEMPPCDGYRHTLQAVDRLFLYAFVALLKESLTEEIGQQLFRILCLSIMLEMLQPDNVVEASDCSILLVFWVHC
jgi:hypothetical protein